MTLTFKCDLDCVKLNQRVKYLNQRLFSSNVIVQRHTQPHCGPTARPGPLNHCTGL